MKALNDLKYAIRLLRKKPSFTLLTTLVMAAGIGLSVYLFSFMNTIIFKPMPFEDGSSLVRFTALQDGVRNSGGINLHDFMEIKNNLKGISEYSSYRHTVVNVAGRDGARRYNAIESDANLFQMTRVKPISGRTFSPTENQMGAERVVVIGYDMWQNQFGGAQNIVDSQVQINGISSRVIGIMPEGYLFPNAADLWLPARQDPTQMPRTETGDFYGIGHIKPGTTFEQINNQLDLIMTRIEQKYPDTNTGLGAYVDTIQMANVGNGLPVVYAMHIAAVLILILASVNVGNLLFSRAIERGKETAIRVALGAPRSRLISQMLWESIIICVVGGLIGLAVLSYGLTITQSVTAGFFVGKPSFWWVFSVDAYTLILLFAFIVGTVIVTGLVPAWKNSGGDFNTVLRDGTRGSLGKKAGRLNRILVISEIFLSMTILIIAGVIMVGTYKTSNADTGANTENVLNAGILLTAADYDTPQKQINFVESLSSRLSNESAIGDVMITTALPGIGSKRPNIAIEGRVYSAEGQSSHPRSNHISVAIGSLAKLGVELKEGRYFNNSDKGLDKNSAIVTESFVQRMFKNEPAIGKRVRIVEKDNDVPRWLTIVGVVEHTNQGTANQPRAKLPSIFQPFSQQPGAQMTVAMQMNADINTVTEILRKTITSIDPQLPAFNIETYEQTLSRSTAPMKFITGIFLMFGIAAVILAASGIYGVMSNTVMQRTQEIGVKRALGATEQRITREFMNQGIKQLLWGGISGLIVGCGLGFVMSKVIGIEYSDLVLIAITLLVIISTVVLYSVWVPTQRALELEPNDALRYE